MGIISVARLYRAEADLINFSRQDCFVGTSVISVETDRRVANGTLGATTALVIFILGQEGSSRRGG